MHTPYDELSYAILRHPAFARAWVASRLPEALREAVDWSTFRPADSRVHVGKLRSLRADLAFVAETLAGDGFVVFVIECKSGPDAGLHAQVLRYVVHIGRVLRRQHGVETALVLPLVLCHGGHPILVSPPPALPMAAARVARRHLPRLRLLVDDLTAATEAELLARALPAAVRLLFLFLQHARGMDADGLLACLGRWGRLLRDVEATADPLLATDVLDAFGWYLVDTTDLTDTDVRMAIQRQLTHPENAPMTTGQRIRIAERNQGLAEGRAEGRAVVARAVQDLLRQRFGELPKALVARIDAAPIEDLQRALSRMLRAERPEDVFGTD
jgi:hypothetical protein